MQLLLVFDFHNSLEVAAPGYLGSRDPCSCPDRVLFAPSLPPSRSTRQIELLTQMWVGHQRIMLLGRRGKSSSSHRCGSATSESCSSAGYESVEKGGMGGRRVAGSRAWGAWGASFFHSPPAVQNRNASHVEQAGAAALCCVVPNLCRVERSRALPNWPLKKLKLT